MNDPRILKYQQALSAMRKGRYDISIPLDSDDDFARLGKAIVDLASDLEKKFGELERLSKITERANAGLVLDEVLNFLYDSFRTVIPYDRIGLALLEEDGQIVRARWARTDAEEVFLKEGYAAQLKGSSLEEVIKVGKPRILNDLESYLRDHPWSESTRRIVQEGMRSSLTCPLKALGKPVGFIFFSSKNTHTYVEEHQDLFLRIAGEISMILEKSRLYQKVVDLNQRLLETQSELEHQATHDPLTKVWNRAAILEVLDKELARSRREMKPLSVVMTDIDRFKALNDTHGHQAGDAVLYEVASRLSSSLRTSEWVGRYGGEEFLIVVYPCDERAAVSLMERLRTQVCSRIIQANGKELVTSISLGAAVGFNTKRIDAETFVRVADEALYRAKNGGRNRSEVSSIEPDR